MENEFNDWVKEASSFRRLPFCPAKSVLTKDFSFHEGEKITVYLEKKYSKTGKNECNAYWYSRTKNPHLPKDCTYLFKMCMSLNDVDSLRYFDASEVINMSGMFTHCLRLRNIDFLKDWDVRNVEKMNHVFLFCPLIESLDALKNWNVESVKTMEEMFHGCKNLADISGVKDWNVKGKETKNIFANCNNIRDFTPLKGWYSPENWKILYGWK